MPQESDDSQWWVDDDLWLDLFRPLFSESPELADRAAKMWHRLLAKIEDGPEGVTHALICLENALRLTFQFTDTYRACEIFYQVSLGESFPANREPIPLLTEAMKRTRRAIKRASRIKEKRRKERVKRRR